MCGPTGGAGDGKNGREKIGRNSEGVIDSRGIEIDVGVEMLLLEHNVGDAFAHLDPFRFADFRAEDLRHALEMRSARIEGLINAMANAHDLLLLLEAFGDVSIDFVE